MLKIGKLARQAGVRASAVRYYERRGLLKRPARLPNSYRLYNEQDVARVRFVRQAQSYGMTLREIGQLLELDRSGVKPCGRTRELASQHLKQVEVKIEELRRLQRQLRRLLRRVPRANGAVCSLIES